MSIKLELVGYFGIVLTIALMSPLAAMPLGWLMGTITKNTAIRLTKKIWQRDNTIIAEYSPPNNLSPAELGYLYDQSFGVPELLATIFDLEQRGVLRLSPVQGNNDGDNFVISSVDKPNLENLLGFEQEVVFTIKSMSSSVRWQRLVEATDIWDLSIENMLRQSLADRGYFVDGSSRRSLGIKSAVLGLCLSVTLMLPYFWSQLSYGGWSILSGMDALQRDINLFVMLLATLLMASGYSAAIYLYIAGYTRAYDVNMSTTKLRRLWPQLAGFKQYLEVVEADNICFENDTIRADVRNHSMPYAVALDMSTRWQDRFKL